MKLCKVVQVTGPDGKEHFAVAALGNLNWPLALCGFATGPNAQASKKEAETFAAAPSMLDMLERLVEIVSNSKPTLSDKELSELSALAERAQNLVEKLR